MKFCAGCETKKPLSAFYSHPLTTDGLIGTCKTCRRKRAREIYNSTEGQQRIVAYERRRARDPIRRAKALEYQRARRRRNPGKYRARYKVSNAIRDGRLNRQPCWCGDAKSEAHHKDYRKPLDVTWLCRLHHDQLEGKRTNN